MKDTANRQEPRTHKLRITSFNELSNYWRICCDELTASRSLDKDVDKDKEPGEMLPT